MKISELSARTDVPVGTIKFYLREGLLAPGRRTSRTAAEYEDAHAERIRLIRALTDVGGLGIAAVRRILTVVDAPEHSRLDLLATAQDALLGAAADGGGKASNASSGAEESTSDPAGAAGGLAAGADGAAGPGGDAGAQAPDMRTRTWAEARGWRTFPEDLVLERLDRAWQACEAAGIGVDETMLDGYAEAMERVAHLDVAAVPRGSAGAVRRVIVGTVMIEPVLQALRMMAQRELSLRRAADENGDAGRC